MLPPDWRRRMARIVRGAEDPDPAWFAGGVVLSPTDQIGVYREQYRLRLGDALRDEVPGLVDLLGEAADPLLFAYLDAHPSQSFTLNRVADALPAFMAESGRPRVELDMVRLDRAVMDGFEAADGRPLELAQLTASPRLRLQSHVRLLELAYDVHDYRSAVIGGKERPVISARPVHLVVFRRNLKMRHLEVDPSCWLVLSAFTRGSDLPGALDRAVASGADPAALESHLGEWFHLFAERDLLQAGDV